MRIEVLADGPQAPSHAFIDERGDLVGQFVRIHGNTSIPERILSSNGLAVNVSA
jgi:hypothetical protein